MTESESIMSEDSISKMFHKLDVMTEDMSHIKTSIATIGTKIEYIESATVKEADMMRYVDGRIDRGIEHHIKSCRNGEESTTRTDVPPRTMKASDEVDRNSGTVRISISGLPPAVRWLLYVAVPTLIGIGGYQWGDAMASENKPQIQSVRPKKAERANHEIDTGTAR